MLTNMDKLYESVAAKRPCLRGAGYRNQLPAHHRHRQDGRGECRRVQPRPD